MSSSYEHLVSFVAKGKTAETNPDAENLTLIETISKQFKDQWMTKLEKIKEECDSKFEECDCKTQILKKVMNEVLKNYTNFYNIVKGSYPSFTSNMFALHKLAAEVKLQINKL